MLEVKQIAPVVIVVEGDGTDRAGSLEPKCVRLSAAQVKCVVKRHNPTRSP